MSWQPAAQYSDPLDMPLSVVSLVERMTTSLLVGHNNLREYPGYRVLEKQEADGRLVTTVLFVPHFHFYVDGLLLYKSDAFYPPLYQLHRLSNARQLRECDAKIDVSVGLAHLPVLCSMFVLEWLLGRDFDGSERRLTWAILQKAHLYMTPIAPAGRFGREIEPGGGQ